MTTFNARVDADVPLPGTAPRIARDRSVAPPAQGGFAVVWAALGRPLRLAGVGLLGMLAGCASGIDMADEACAKRRSTMADYTDCLRTNRATLVGGMPDQRDLATLYLAQAEYQTAQVHYGRSSDADAMLALAIFRTNTLAAEEQKRQQATIDRYVKAIEASVNQAGSSAGSASSSGGGSDSASAKPSYSGSQVRWR